MEMKVLQCEKRLCTCCMEEHEVKTVRVKEHGSFKKIPIDYEAVYFYCDAAEEFYMDEKQMRQNDIAVKNGYRKVLGLLTSDEIAEVREKYSISQNDLCIILGWGGKTITRYESHQVQDRAHDTILRKIDSDPEWFIMLLERAKDNLQTEAYRRYMYAAAFLYEKNQDFYLRKAIEARYARFQGNQEYHGNTSLSLDKAVDMIRYFSSSKKVSSLYKVKLMKLLWYADALSYKMRGHAISGLVYQALPMGAVPIGHESIIDLRGVPCEEVDMGDTCAYHFFMEGSSEYPALSEEDRKVLDIVADCLGQMSKKEIVEFMHREQAYLKTAQRDIIPFQYTESLQI